MSSFVMTLFISFIITITDPFELDTVSLFPLYPLNGFFLIPVPLRVDLNFFVLGVASTGNLFKQFIAENYMHYLCNIRFVFPSGVG